MFFKKKQKTLGITKPVSSVKIDRIRILKRSRSLLLQQKWPTLLGVKYIAIEAAVKVNREVIFTIPSKVFKQHRLSPIFNATLVYGLYLLKLELKVTTENCANIHLIEIYCPFFSMRAC